VNAPVTREPISNPYSDRNDSATEILAQEKVETTAAFLLQSSSHCAGSNHRLYGMDAPYPIATLPAPLDKEQGRIQAAPVHALKGSKKRKRHEIAVTVDGEGISVYNVLPGRHRTPRTS
jgi:hypothetical protein